MATRTWTSNVSTNTNLATNYSGAGALLSTDDLVFDGTGSAVAIATAVLSVKSITISGTASFTGNGFNITVTSGTGIVCSGSGTITMTGASSAWTIAGTTGALSLAFGPTYTFGATTFNITISAAACAITINANVTINVLTTNTANQVVTWTPTASTLTMTSGGSASWGNASYVEWKSATPGSQYKIDMITPLAPLNAMKITDCWQTGATNIDASASVHINGGNNTGWNIYQALSRVNSSLAATATDIQGGESWAKAMGTINRGSLVAAETRLLASPDTAFTGLTFANTKGTAATPNRYLDVASGNLSSFGALIDACESGWVAANGATITGYTAAGVKNGTAGKLSLTFPAVPVAATKYAYKTIGSTSVEAFANLCTWIRVQTESHTANSVQFQLCSDTLGATPVKTALTDEILVASNNISFSKAWTSLSANNIQSIAIYSGPVVAPVANSAIIYDTFYATVAGFDLNSVLHKSFNYRGAAWAPLTNYAVGTKIVPTFGARSPLVFEQMAAAGGVSAATEYFTDADGQSKPIWDKAYLPAMGDFAGQLVTDGTCIWKCLGDDEAYYFWAIKSLDFTANGGKGRIEIDNHPGNVGNAGRGYYGTDETVAFSYLTPYLYPMAAVATTVMDSIGGSGTDLVPKTVSGGYNTSDVVVGVTFISGRNGLGYGLQSSSKHAIKITGGIGYARYQRGYNLLGSYGWSALRNMVVVSVTDTEFLINISNPGVVMAQHCLGFNAGSVNYPWFSSGINFRGSFGIKIIGSLGTAFNNAALNFGSSSGIIRDICAYNNAGYGIGACDGMTFINARTALNATASFAAVNNLRFRCKNTLVGESTVVGAGVPTNSYGAPVWFQNFNGTTGDNRAYYPSMGQATYATATHIWTIAVNSVNATAQIPLRHELGPVRINTVGVPCTISVQVNPSAANIKCQLKIPANVIAGVQFDTYSESSGSGLQTLTTTFTPLEAGIFKPVLDCFINNTTLTSTISVDLDSFAATQNGVALAVAGIGDQLFGEEMFVSRGDMLSYADEIIRNTDAGVDNVKLNVSYKHLSITKVGIYNPGSGVVQDLATVHCRSKITRTYSDCSTLSTTVPLSSKCDRMSLQNAPIV